MSTFFLFGQSGNICKQLNLGINHFPSLIQAKHGKLGKWGRSDNFFSSNNYSGSSPNRPLRIRGSSKNSFGNFDDGFESGKKPLSSSELLFFSTGQSYASYPLNHQIQTPQSKMKDALKAMMKPAEVRFEIIT